MKFVLYVLICALLFSCNSSKDENKQTNDVVYDMYIASEMAILMNQMYDYNLQLKEDILNGKSPENFPLEFLKIHTAELSEFKDRNATFKSFSNVFINAEKEIFNTASTIEIQERYNSAINVCISCHRTECTGPIPKIKKLLIK